MNNWKITFKTTIIYKNIQTREILRNTYNKKCVKHIQPKPQNNVVLVSQGYSNKVSKTGQLKRNLLSHILEGRCSKSGCQQHHTLSDDPRKESFLVSSIFWCLQQFLAFFHSSYMAIFFLNIFILSALCAYLSLLKFPLFIRTSVILDQGSPQCSQKRKLDYLCQDSISNMVTSQGTAGQDFNVYF